MTMTASTLTINEKLAAVDRLRDKYLSTPRDAQFRSYLDRLLQRDEQGNLLPKPRLFNKAGDARGIAVVEPAGGGKTSLVHHGLKTHPALQPRDAAHQPWVGVRVPSPATAKSLGIEILSASGYPSVSRSQTEDDIMRKVRHHFRLRGTAILWIDEAHDLFGAGSKFKVDVFLKTVRNLMQGDGAVSVVLSGVESLWQIASCDAQVTRRYWRLPLGDVSPHSDRNALTKVIAGFCNAVGVQPPSDEDLVDRLVHASRNRFGRCIENILAALEAAALVDADELTINHFAESWGMQEGCGMGQNVFLARHWARIDLGEAQLFGQGAR
ncbi:TniB family NTP-binding protein [Maritimibacter fusiformis]|uniref:AAA family ATPase n=1 Tax=Maritimibacter fusiformis TaxID=2603819 RepID=A0A5D0RG78_9RHOB|nr:TniB family NTP-binding protein [Maritimibacter fusiformis]TYB80522.1 AAA family ATPase [Maritimibacter fusiformis]